jgi:FkbM family methyltransferase
MANYIRIKLLVQDSLKLTVSQLFVIVTLNQPRIAAFAFRVLKIPNRWKAYLIKNTDWTFRRKVCVENCDAVIQSKSKHDDFYYLAFSNPFEWELSSLKAWIRFVEKGKIAIDVGAYIGVYSVFAGKLGAQVYAFEPNPFIYKDMDTNLEINNLRKDVKLYKFGISNTNAIRYLNFDHGPFSSGTNLTMSQENEARPVEVKSLDEVVPLLNPITVIKIDTEGSELDVLRGSVKIIERWKPTFIIESLSPTHREEIYSYLKNFGYTCEKLENTHNFSYEFRN